MPLKKKKEREVCLILVKSEEKVVSPSPREEELLSLR